MRNFYLLEGDLAEAAIAAHGQFININPDDKAAKLDNLLEGVEPISKEKPKLTVDVAGAYQNGNVVLYYSNYMFPNGPTGHSGVTIVNDAGSWHIAMHTTNVTPPKQQ